ncbi:MAG: aldehyde dehydrogenase family protein [Rhodospirillales bacterium]|nr:aldehyde dehydrogenase family protein [Rhodospirillales bacterium]
MTLHVQQWIGNRWVESLESGLGKGVCLNPATGSEVGTYDEAGAADAEAAIALARKTFETTNWARQPRLRAQVLLEFADRLEARKTDIAKMLVAVNGKLMHEAMVEPMGGASEIRYYAGLARNLFGRMAEIDTGCYSLLAREPAGVAGIIVPWNAPLLLLVRSLAPAMAAGCTSVVKLAHQTSLATKIVIEVLAEVKSLPPGVVSFLHESGSRVSETLVRSPEVDVVSFTGSSAVGKKIMAAGAGTLKRLSLELGGKAPSLVFPDCDRKKAVAAIAGAATVMAGQMCTAAGRVLVHQTIAKEFERDLKAAFENVVTGPGDDPASTMGPLIDRANRDRVQGIVEAAEKVGRMIVKGRPLDGNLASGAFLTPTLMAIEDVKSRFVQDELFGPVLNFETFADEAEAVERANATRYGLAASLWTADQARASRVSRALKSGTVWINSYNKLFAEAETGGYRESGFGRLHGVEGLNDFLQTKHVYFEAPPIA